LKPEDNMTFYAEFWNKLFCCHKFAPYLSAAIRNQTWWAKIKLVIHVLMHMDNGIWSILN